MILSTGCIDWAALRSGLSLPDFMASLNPEREEEILDSCNAWRKSKGLPKVRQQVTELRVTELHVTESQAFEPRTPTQDDAPRMTQADDAGNPQDDEVADPVSKIA